MIGLNAKAERTITGSFVNDAFPLGHKLRDRTLAVSPKQTVKIPIVIVGGGIAGLSRSLATRQEEASATSCCSRWSAKLAATRDPAKMRLRRIPGPRTTSQFHRRALTLVRELMEEFGVLKNGEWNERYLCYSPQERLFLHGRWQEDIEPLDGSTARDREQMKRFSAIVQRTRAYGTVHGSDGARRETFAARSGCRCATG